MRKDFFGLSKMDPVMRPIMVWTPGNCKVLVAAVLFRQWRAGFVHGINSHAIPQKPAPFLHAEPYPQLRKGSWNKGILECASESLRFRAPVGAHE
jgi:hypothetical protein